MTEFDDQPLIVNPGQPLSIGNGSISILLKGKDVEKELMMVDDLLRGKNGQKKNQ